MKEIKYKETFHCITKEIKYSGKLKNLQIEEKKNRRRLTLKESKTKYVVYNIPHKKILPPPNSKK